MKNLKLIISIFLTSLLANGAIANTKVWDFKVFYGESEIGQHVFEVDKTMDKSNVTIKATFDLSIFFIPVYSYRHNNTELWKGNCLHSIKSTTDDNGESFSVSGKETGDYFAIEKNGSNEEYSGCVKTFSYWDIDILESEELLNAQTGEVLDVEIDFVANEKKVIRNKEINTKRYILKTDEFNIDLWYSDDDEWVALNSITKDGGELSYVIQ